MKRKIIGIIAGFIVGFFIYSVTYQIIIELTGGYDSENFHNLMKSVPIVKPGLWLISFFIGSVIAGYIAKSKGKIVGLLSALPIIIATFLSLIQHLLEANTGRVVAGGYPIILLLLVGIILVPYLGGGFGEALAVGKLRKNEAFIFIGSFLFAIGVLVILLWKIIIINLWISFIISWLIAHFLASLIVTFPPFYRRLKK